jgi:flagellar hook-associated protein 1 FlgK
MIGPNNLLEIGKKSLFANQAAIQVIGNNISNANTEGYSRQAVRLEDGLYIDYTPGQIGTGVNAKEVIRFFDEFIESQYLSKSSAEARWSTLYENLQSAEAVFNESNSEGVNSALAEFWASWQELSADPGNASIRTALLGKASNLQQAVGAVADDMAQLQNGMDALIEREVKEINAIMADIAETNAQITITEDTGRNNANSLRDQRATLVRQLAEKIDITYIDNGLGNVTINTTSGYTLVDGTEVFRLAFEAVPKGIPDQLSTSPYDGEVTFAGSSSSEYTVEIVTGGIVTGGGVQFRVSQDGGKTWLKDENDNTSFTASPQGILLPDGKGTLAFSAGTGGSLVTGDRFTVLPNKSLFWYQTSSSKVNVTPQTLPNGEDNDRRLTGGVLTGYLQFRDGSLGGYLEKLDAFSASLAWEVNRIHSQGTGTERFGEVVGTYRVDRTDAILGNAESGLAFGDKMAAGNVMIHVYNETTGALEESKALDFDDAAAGIQNFDPAVHTLEDVVAAINFTFDGISASVADRRLQITAGSGRSFAFGTDSSGLLAALCAATFFEGAPAGRLAIHAPDQPTASFITAGHVNGAGEMNEGDNTTASAIAALQGKAVKVATASGGSSSQTLGEYYSALVSRVGSDTSSARFNFEYQAALAADLKARQDAVSGVNLDEEMTSLIKFQHAYTAAAKLITTADSMMEVLLGLKA